MGKKPVKDALNLEQVLCAVEPPEDDQIVEYVVETGVCGGGELHSVDCLERSEDLWRMERVQTTGRKLRASLAKHQVTVCCGDWNLGSYMHAVQLIENSQKADDDNVADCRLLLHYEAWKPRNVKAWRDWLGLGNPKKIREAARAQLDWDNNPGGLLLVCFNVRVGDNPGSWIAGVGVHETMQAGWGENTLVHGVVPGGVYERTGEELSKIVVEVDETFTATHLKLAVALYEDSDRLEVDLYEGGDSTYGGSLQDYQEAAARAVETAKLAVG